ncbi:DUF3311 domain-containing protein [Epidermidibacterium keratini]|uniref:DUF3311 domain-containing protein n=1 Tax=Epidermidibacterium keratini TaxID=1891644 RepID=A0A7L4YK50_9ACTN|nr:DUF3311 domain-containing protein [Epidermidibacterium keratini]QHB99262.1 DUF3311 domain-containing protein [Epidermidibacterium keratini]
MPSTASAGSPDRAPGDTGLSPDELRRDDDNFVPPKRNPWHFLLIVPFVLPLLTPVWNKQSPELFGIPFFYWSQLALVVFCSLMVGLVYIMTKRK